MHLLTLVTEACAAGTPAHGIVLKMCRRYMGGIDFRAAAAAE